MGEISYPAPIPETGNWSVDRAKTPDNFTKAIKDNRDKLGTERYDIAAQQGVHVFAYARHCRFAEMMEAFASFVHDIDLVGEGIEHLAPKSNLEDIRRRIEVVKGALVDDLVDTMTRHCGCEKVHLPSTEGTSR
jgi:hypothetical protein